MNKKRLFAIFAIIVTLLATLIPTETFAKLVVDGNGGEFATARARVAFRYGNNNVDRDWYDENGEKCIPDGTSGTYRPKDGNGTCSYRAAALEEDDNTKEDKIDNILGSGHISIDVQYDLVDGKNIIKRNTVNLTGNNLFKILAPSDSGKEYYKTDGDGNVIISAKEDANMSCKILAGAGNTIEDFNQSMYDCAKSMDSWTQRCGDTVNMDATICSFGKVTFWGINGESEIFNEEELSGDAKDAIAKDEVAEGDACYKSGGALSWVLCPIIQMAADFSKWFYDSVVKPQLEIQASGIFETYGGVYQAWSGFRDIANVVFVILFLIVIISQLTGYGIDNYGIKRMLPRIIIAAILINVSYFICQLAVDIANIIGVSIGDFLNGFVDGQLEVGLTSPDVSQYVFTFAAASIGVGALLISPGIIVTILISAVGVLISLITLLAILTARQAAVVILIVISPLALVCYLLPNTENLTKKWLKVAEAMLLLYPICSIIIAAGSLAGNVIADASSGNDGMIIAAMLVQVIPYLAIPSLVKNSMAGLGNLGARISNLGERASKGTTTRLNRSDAVKNFRTKLDNIDPGGVRNKFTESKFAKKTGFGRHRRAQQIEAAAELNSREARDRRLLSKEGQGAIFEAQTERENEQAVSDYTAWYGKPENTSAELGEKLVELLGKDDQESLNRASAISDTLAARGDLSVIRNATKAASANGEFSTKARQNLADNLLTGKQARTVSSKDPILVEWAKANNLSNDEVSMQYTELSAITSLSPNNLPDMKTQAISQIHKTISDAKAQAAQMTDGEAKNDLNNMIGSAEAHMQKIAQTATTGRVAERLDDEHEQAIKSFLPPKDNSSQDNPPQDNAPIAKQTSGTGQTLDLQNSKSQTADTTGSSSQNRQMSNTTGPTPVGNSPTQNNIPSGYHQEDSGLIMPNKPK